MRKSICFMMISVSLFAALLSLRVQAASGDGLRLDEGGTVTVVSQHAAKEGISSLCFSLSVESANGASVEFQFGDSKAKILDYRYDAAAGNLKVYLAGTEALFAEGTDALTVGKIKVLDGGGNEVTATVSAVENSLQYVYGTEVKTMLEVELPEAVQIGPAPVQPPPSQPRIRQPLRLPQRPRRRRCSRLSCLWYCLPPGLCSVPEPPRVPGPRKHLQRIRQKAPSRRKRSPNLRRKAYRMCLHRRRIFPHLLLRPMWRTRTRQTRKKRKLICLW